MPQLRRFIFRIENRTSVNKAFGSKDDPVHFDVQDNFRVADVGHVASGIMKAGTVKIG